MKLIRLRIENDAMDIAYHPVSGQAATAHYLIAYNSDQTIGENLGLCQPVLMKLYLESNSFTNWVLFFDFDFELNLNSINKVLPVLVTIRGSFDLLDFTVHTFDGTI
ncbi:hypothetical protein C7M34_01308 [Lactiplantibacillus plantarum]|nr:hypothetical protein C7M34_01308 [Lactiplantibacillus plantarum]